jgi:hypothetical protein
VSSEIEPGVIPTFREQRGKGGKKAEAMQSDRREGGESGIWKVRGGRALRRRECSLEANASEKLKKMKAQK